MKRDQELCADAYAMSLMDEACISEYGRTLLSAVVQDKSRRHAVMTAGITENRRTMKQRIRNVAAFSKRKYRLTLAGIGLILSAAFFLCTSQVNYPQTAQERMAFDDRVQMAVYPADVNSPRNMNVQIFNRNPIAINSCELEIFNGRPDKPESIPVYSNKDFRIGGNQFKSLSIEGIDFNSAYIRFNFKVGFAFDQSNMTFQSGDMACFDKTYLVNGWGPATDDETSDFIRGKNIKASSVNQLYGFLTVILFENGEIRAGVKAVGKSIHQLLRLLPHTAVEVHQQTVEVIVDLKIVAGQLVKQHPAASAEHLNVPLIIEGKQGDNQLPQGFLAADPGHEAVQESSPPSSGRRICVSSKAARERRRPVMAALIPLMRFLICRMVRRTSASVFA